MALFNKRKLVLDATTRTPTKYSDFTKGYRSSSNLIDQRDGQGDLRVAMDLMGYIEDGVKKDSRDRYKKGPTPIDRIDDTRTKRTGGGGSTGTGGDPYDSSGNTPDDYGVTEFGPKKSDTTSARKVSPEEAIDRTFNKRK